jgi:cell wall-associated NlpC family hydrolase
MKKAIAFLGITTVMAAGAIVAGAPEADAATIEGKALSIAMSKRGDAYQYGAAGPYRFDCSGLTYYSFRHAGHALPRTAQSQYDHVRHISASSRQKGDLVFFGSTHGIYHVGIYVGSGEIVNANSGSYRGYHVLVAPIREYGSNVHYGRL